MNGSAKLLLGRRGDGDRSDAGDMRGDDVHHDARGVDRLPAGHVETDAGDRLPALDDLRPGRHLGHGGLWHLCPVAFVTRSMASSSALRTAGERPATASEISAA